MGKVRAAEPCLLFIGMLFSASEILDVVQRRLEEAFGPLLLSSPITPWDYSDYYADELGTPLFRKFLFFRDAIDPGILADIKIRTNEIEAEFSANGKRRVNLDPGYLSSSKIVLASTKDYAHRIYLGKGIYGEVTLYFQGGQYRPHLFTYRDYAEKAYADMFAHVRGLFRKQRAGKNG